MKFRASFCDPFKPDIIEMGDIPEETIIDRFEKIPWSNLLKEMEGKTDDEIHFSPSLEIENKENSNGLSISAVGDPYNIEFYIFYKRPKLVKILFGLSTRMNDNYTTDIKGQTKKDVLDCLKALLKNDLAYLENKIK